MAPGIGPGSRVGWRGALVFQDDFLGGTPDTIGRANLSIQATGTLVNIAAVGNVSLSLASAGVLTAYIPPPRVAVVQTSNARGGGATSINLTLNGVAAGSALVLCVNYIRDGTSGPTAVLTGGMTTGDGSAQLAAKSGVGSIGGYGGTSQIFIQPNMTAGNKTVTIAFTGDPYTWATLTEVAGLHLTSPQDVSATNTGTGTALTTGTTATTSQDDTIAFMICTSHSNNTNTTHTTPAGFTLIDSEIDGSNYADGISAYRVNNTAGTQSAASTCNRNVQWCAAIAAFKAAPTADPDALQGSTSMSLAPSAKLRSYGHAGPDIGAVVVKAPDGTTPLTTQTTAPVDTAVSGSTFVIAAMYDNTTTSSASDNMGNTYTLVGTQSFIDPVRLSVYVCEDGDGGAGHTFSHTTAATSPYTSVFGVETFTPGAGAPTYGGFTSNRDVATPFTLAGPTTTVDNELLLDFAQYFHDGLADGQDNAGFTKVVEQPNGTLANAGALFARTASTPGTYSSSVVAAASEATLQLMMSLLPGAPVGGDGAMVGSASLALAPSGALAGTGRLVGATSVSLAPAGALAGSGRLVGGAALALASAATLRAAGALVGSSSVALVPAGALSASAEIVGATSLSVGATGTLRGEGRLVGSVALAIIPTATLYGAVAIAGSTQLNLAAVGTLEGAGALVGGTTIVFTPSGTLATSVELVGSASLSIGATGTLWGAGRLAGSAPLSLAPSAALRGAGRLAGATTVAISGQATLFGALSQIVGTTSLSLQPSATLGGALQASGTVTLSLAAAGTLSGTTHLVGTTSLLLATQAEGMLFGELVGSASLSFELTAELRGSGALAGATTIFINGRATPAGYTPPVGPEFVIEWFDTVDTVVWAEPAAETIMLYEDLPAVVPVVAKVETIIWAEDVQTVEMGAMVNSVVVWEDAP